MKIVDLRKFIFALCITILVLISLYFAFFINLNNLVEERETKEIIVSSGDTLWSIAIENKQESESIQEYISSVKKLNNMKTSDLKAGQNIKIYM